MQNLVSAVLHKHWEPIRKSGCFDQLCVAPTNISYSLTSVIGVEQNQKQIFPVIEFLRETVKDTRGYEQDFMKRVAAHPTSLIFRFIVFLN